MLGALLVFLIVSNFLAQRELQDLSLRNLRQDLEKRAAAVSYFYAERENDLKTLAAISGLSGYFAMQAAGVSGKDLEASLEAVRQNFERFLKERKLGGSLFSAVSPWSPRRAAAWWQCPGKGTDPAVPGHGPKPP